MKKQTLLLALFILLTSQLFSQIPAMTFTPYYTKKDSSKQFEKIGANLEAKAIGMGYGGYNNYYTIQNSPKSSVRFKAGTLLQGGCNACSGIPYN